MATGLAPSTADAPGSAAGHAAARDALFAQLLQSTEGAFRLLSVYIGDQLGFYAALALAPALTATELAARTGTQPRYVREWLEQQVVAGLLVPCEPDEPAGERRFALPAGHAEVLVDGESVHYLAPLAQVAAGAARPLRFVLDAFQHGGGVPFGAYGADLRDGLGRLNRAAYLRQLGPEWLAAVPGLAERLARPPAARIADIGCGVGWASIGVARSYPHARVDGIDTDTPSIDRAREHARVMGVADRVHFESRDATAGGVSGQYDVVMSLDCVHTLADPVGLLRAMRRLARRDGVVLVGCARVGTHLGAPDGALDPLAYGWSLLHGLPVGMAQEPSAATGSVMRIETLRGYAREAGFGAVTVVPIEHRYIRLHQLHP